MKKSTPKKPAPKAPAKKEAAKKEPVKKEVAKKEVAEKKPAEPVKKAAAPAPPKAVATVPDKPVHNAALREELNALFSAIAKEIGNNRQQLASRVLNVHLTINRELSKAPVDAVREKALRQEVAATIKSISNQLPHLSIKPADAMGRKA